MPLIERHAAGAAQRHSTVWPLRVWIAHAILDSGEPTLLADEGLDLQKLTKWLPLAKCIARRMLKVEFPPEFLPFVAEDGSVRG
jgi:hypothetical protein